jgi:hypothetical protein
LAINTYFPGSEQEQLMPVIVTIKLISVPYKRKLPAKTELGKIYILSRVRAAEVEKVKCLSGKRKKRKKTFCQKNKVL